MANFKFKMPDIGEGIVDTEVVTWHVSVGDPVQEDAPLADVMTDKATVEITSPVSGTVASLGCSEGEKIVIGANFVEFILQGDKVATEDEPEVIDNDANVQSSLNTVCEPSPERHEQAVENNVAATVTADESTGAPTPAETQVAKQRESFADNREGFETPSLPPTKPKIRVVTDVDPANAPAISNAAQSDSSDRQTQQRSATPTVPPVAIKKAATAVPTKEVVVDIRKNVADANTPQREIIQASPAVRRLALDLELDLATVPGSGPGGRVTKADIRQLVLPVKGHSGMPPHQSKESLQSAAVTSSDGRQTVTTPSVTGLAKASADGSNHSSGTERGQVDSMPVIGLRRLIAERMQLAKQNIPHFSYVEEVEVEQLERLRQQLNTDRQDGQPKLSLLHLLLLGVSRVVTAWPQCNANYDDDAGVLHQYKRVHLGVATMTENGLMVPVIHNACQLGIWELASEVNRLAESARSGRLDRDELTGSTITVSSLGPLAGITTTPVINRPETSILGPNKMMERVKIIDGVAVNVRVMNVSSSFDHRVVDGYDAACFIQEVKKRLEHPALLFAS